jgi:hypothetical protein
VILLAEAASCGRLPPVSLLSELDAFDTEHRRCGELEAGVEGPTVWIACDCGATVTPGGGLSAGDGKARQ